MPSTYTGSGLVEKQAAGENLNTWGGKLNTALAMVIAMAHGLTEHTLTANKSLTNTNGTQTDGTDGVHKITSSSDGGYTLTVASQERSYLIWNASSYDQVISAGGTTCTVYAGEIIPVYCDGTDCVRFEVRRLSGALNMGGYRITNAATPTANADLVTKAYADGLALAQSDLPGQNSGTEYASVRSDGSAATWQLDYGPEVITATETLVARVRPYLCVMSGGAFTVTLPASPSDGDIVRIMTDNNASTNTLTVARNSETIGDLSEDMEVDTNGASLLLYYTSSNWVVIGL